MGKTATAKRATRRQRPHQTPQSRPSTSVIPFAALDAASRRHIARTMLAGLRKIGYYGRGKFNSVSGEDVRLRKRLPIETGPEDEALPSSERLRLIALARDMARNSAMMNGFLKQLELNVVGNVGGKASFKFGEEYKASAVTMREAFAEWAAACDFFDGNSLGKLLRIALKTKYLTGDAVFLFDDGIIADTGKILLFEGDSIASFPDSYFRTHFPGYTQRQGIIKDSYGRKVGAIVSASQRGKSTFEPYGPDGALAAWPLLRAPGAEWIDSPFYIYSNTYRANQGRGTPNVASSLDAIIDVEDMTKYELQSSKKNAQTLATVTYKGEPGAPLPDGMEPPPRLDDNATDADIDAAAESIAGDAQDDLELDVLEGAGVLYDILPPDLQMNLLDTKHPNSGMEGFVGFMTGRIGWANGMASFYASGKADKSFSAVRGEQMLTWPMFEDEQHDLESGPADWILRRWHSWAVRHGRIPADLALPPYWWRAVKWTWPRCREIDAVNEQTAMSARLRNFTGSLAEYYGADWREKLAAIREELDYCRELGIPHPALQTVSGQMIDSDLSIKKEKTA